MRWGTYRMFFANVKDVIKLNYFCKKLGINLSNLSTFINYGTHSITIDKLELLYNSIMDYLKEIA